MSFPRFVGGVLSSWLLGFAWLLMAGGLAARNLTDYSGECVPVHPSLFHLSIAFAGLATLASGAAAVVELSDGRRLGGALTFAVACVSFLPIFFVGFVPVALCGVG